MKKYYDVEVIEKINLTKFFDNEDIEKSKKPLQITNKGIYAITRFYDAEWISKIILENCKCNFTITDCTGGVGGNIINFSKYFKTVYGIELNPITFNVLKHNIESLNIQNVILKNDNSINLIPFIKSDIVFVDPPWGGTLYKKIKYFNLKLGKLPISFLINKFYENKTIKYVVLKCPYNINTTHLFKYSNYNNIQIFKNNHIWIIIFSN
jgi:hypothetical protein